MDVLAERILLDLKNTFKKDPLIDEFDVLPVDESVSNKCPVVHIEHKIALEKWCVKHVYVYAYSKFFAWRKKPYKIDHDCLLSWTCAILLINPDIETAWNARKELVSQNVLHPENELKFSELVLSRKPKSSPIYAHRKWVLLELLGRNCSSVQQLAEHEFYLCTRFANLYPSNYYAWCHRAWVLTELCGNSSKVTAEELVRSEQWVSVHVSDHCGFHYRQFLLSPDCFLKELSLLGGMQTTYLGHETLWYHRRYVLHAMNSVEDVPGERCKRHKLAVWDCTKEEAFVRGHWKIAQNYAWERTLVERHLKWLRDVVSWHVSLLS